MVSADNNVGIAIRISKEKKEAVKKVLKEKDLKLATVLKLCINEIIRTGELPFSIK